MEEFMEHLLIINTVVIYKTGLSVVVKGTVQLSSTYSTFVTERGSNQVATWV